MLLFPISKYLKTFKWFVEKRNTFADMLMKIFFEIFLVQPIPLFQMPAYAFSDSLSYLVIFSYFLAWEIAPLNLTWANQHVKLKIWKTDWLLVNWLGSQGKRNIWDFLCKSCRIFDSTGNHKPNNAFHELKLPKKQKQLQTNANY